MRAWVREYVFRVSFLQKVGSGKKWLLGEGVGEGGRWGIAKGGTKGGRHDGDGLKR